MLSQGSHGGSGHSQPRASAGHPPCRVRAGVKEGCGKRAWPPRAVLCTPQPCAPFRKNTGRLPGPTAWAAARPPPPRAPRPPLPPPAPPPRPLPRPLLKRLPPSTAPARVEWVGWEQTQVAGVGVAQVGCLTAFAGRTCFAVCQGVLSPAACEWTRLQECQRGNRQPADPLPGQTTLLQCRPANLLHTRAAHAPRRPASFHQAHAPPPPRPPTTPTHPHSTTHPHPPG